MNDKSLLVALSAIALSVNVGFAQRYMDVNGTTANFGSLSTNTWNTANTNWTSNAAGTDR